MTDDVDEWAHEARCLIERAEVDGRKSVTLTAPIAVAMFMVERTQDYFKREGARCFLCEAMREAEQVAPAALQEIEHAKRERGSLATNHIRRHGEWKPNPNWQRPKR